MPNRGVARLGGYERDWRMMDWLVVETAVIEPLLVMKAGCVPCAVLPHGFIGPGREFVLAGMMIHIAERWPEMANPLSVFHAPQVTPLSPMPPPRDSPSTQVPKRDEDDGLSDKLIRWGR